MSPVLVLVTINCNQDFYNSAWNANIDDRFDLKDLKSKDINLGSSTLCADGFELLVDVGGFDCYWNPHIVKIGEERKLV